LVIDEPVDSEVFEAWMPNQAYKDVFTATSVATGSAMNRLISMGQIV